MAYSKLYIVTGTNLVNEGGEAVVEGLDLLLLLGADTVDVGVDLQVQRGQQALVDLDRCDGWSDESASSLARRKAVARAGHTKASTRASTEAATRPISSTKATSTIGSLDGEAAASSSCASGGPPDAAARADRHGLSSLSIHFVCSCVGRQL